MSLQTELSEFFTNHFTNDELRRLVARLPQWAVIRAELPSTEVSPSRYCGELSELLERIGAINESLFSLLRESRANLTSEIDRIVAFAAEVVTDIGVAWRKMVERRLGGRLVLRDVDGAGYALEAVYVELELLLQRPVPAPLLRATEGECGEARSARPDSEEQPDGHAHALEVKEQPLDLVAWLTAPLEGAPVLLIEGEVGTGKTELLTRAARSLAQNATADAPLPLWVDVSRLAREGLVRAISSWSEWTEEDCQKLLRRPDIKFAVFVDSLDEYDASIASTISRAQEKLGARLHRLVLATRPAQRRTPYDV